jgi:hypothetical protein
MPTDTIKWIEINLKVLDTINDNRSIIGSTEEADSVNCWLEILLGSLLPRCPISLDCCRYLMLLKYSYFFLSRKINRQKIRCPAQHSGKKPMAKEQILRVFFF